jgi:hypothetical protein
MEKWKPLRASHFSTPPTATDLLTHPLRYTLTISLVQNIGQATFCE